MKASFTTGSVAVAEAEEAAVGEADGDVAGAVASEGARECAGEGPVAPAEANRQLK